MKIKNVVAKAICAAVILWLLGSWADVLAHNAPCYGDYQYQSWNAIVLLEETLR